MKPKPAAPKSQLPWKFREATFDDCSIMGRGKDGCPQRVATVDPKYRALIVRRVNQGAELDRREAAFGAMVEAAQCAEALLKITLGEMGMQTEEINNDPIMVKLRAAVALATQSQSTDAKEK